MSGPAALVALVLLGAFLVAVGYGWGFVYRWVWSLVHGGDRTLRASRMLVLAAVVVQVLLAGAGLAVSVEDPGVALLGAGAVALLGVPYAAGLYTSLRRPVPFVEASARPPSIVLPD